MNKLYLIFCSTIALILASCTEDTNSNVIGEGTLSVKVGANNDVNEFTSRSIELESPKVDDFSIFVINQDDESVVSKWDKFSEFVPTTIKVGKYNVVASYGDLEAEGVDALSYYGSSEVNITENQTTETSITCFISKAIVSVSYSDSFKKYFTSYSSSINTAKGNKLEVTFSSDKPSVETKSADSSTEEELVFSTPLYVKPGNISLTIDVTRPGIEDKISITPFEVEALAKTEYRITLDVDAATSTLKISFYDSPQHTEDVEINISDENLSNKKPEIIAHGYTSEEIKEFTEGTEYTGDELYSYINAQSGISKCELTTQSKYLISQGWPETVDLVGMTSEEEAKLKDLGLSFAGFSANVDKIATVNFTDLIDKLYCSGNEDETHIFTLTVTDKFGRESEPSVLSVKTLYSQFDFTCTSGSIPYNSDKLEFNVKFKGDINDVVFQEIVMGTYNPISEDRITITPNKDGVNYKVVISGFKNITDIENGFKIKSSVYNHSKELLLNVEAPVLNLYLKNGDADVWATKAYLSVEATAESRLSRTISSETVQIQYKNGGTWEKWPNQSFDSEKNVFLIEGLGDSSSSNGKNYNLRAVYISQDEVVESSISREITITTEDKSQVPNSGFEDWYSEMVWEKSSWITGGLKIYSFYPYSKDNSDKWWSTNNELTTQHLGDYSWYYAAYPAVVPTNAEDMHTALWHIKTYGNPSDFGVASITNDVAASGSTAMEISTVGYGKNNWSAGLHKTQYISAGELFIGTYSISNGKNLGHVFGSRPIAFRFSYKFYPYNSETAKAYIVLYDDAKNQIGYGELIISEAYDSYQSSGNIIVEYSNEIKKASYISIGFISSNSDSPQRKDIQGSNKISSEDARHIGSVFVVDNVELVY